MKPLSIYLLLALLVLPRLLLSEPIQIQTQVEPSVCKPGDVVTLRAEYSGAEYIEFSLQLPEHPSLHIAQNVTDPISYKDGIYRQVSTIILQPIQPGSFEIDELSATVLRKGIETEQALPSLHITVDAYDTSEVSNTPLQLPPSPEFTGISQLPIQFWILFFFLGCFIGLCVIRVRTAVKTIAEIETSQPTLADITQALEAGKVPSGLIVAVLEDPKQQLSKTTRQILEQVAYRPSETTDTDALLQTLRREASS
ncbi:MAG: hypothetical protein ACSHX8_00260 [Opitutaceae bacterium]